MSKLVRGMTWALIGLILAAVSGCQPDDPSQTESGSTGETTMSIVFTSSAFKEGETIPVEYTCNGQNISPPLAWTNLPTDTQSLALIADDPDAPSGTWVHWVLYNLPPGTNGLPVGAQNPGDSGPCPPAGKPHRYFFKIYALDTRLDLDPGAGKADLEQAMQGHILAQGQLMGTFSR